MKTKKCEYCQSEMDVNAKLCPNCKKWVFEKKHRKVLKMLTVVIGILVLLLIFVIAASNTPIDCTDKEMIAIGDIYKEASANKARALDLYNDEYFKFEGKVSHIYNKYVQIDDKNAPYSVFFYFDSKYREQVKELNIGDEITFCGRLQEGAFTSWNVKNGCIIDVKKQND